MRFGIQSDLHVRKLGFGVNAHNFPQIYYVDLFEQKNDKTQIRGSRDRVVVERYTTSGADLDAMTFPQLACSSVQLITWLAKCSLRECEKHDTRSQNPLKIQPLRESVSLKN